MTERDECTAEAAAKVARNLALGQELIQIAEALEHAGIRVAILKGLPLVRRLGLPLHDRALIDNDILVPRDQVRSAESVLFSLGYRAMPRHPLELDVATGFQHVMIRRTTAGLPLCVELHWRAFSPLHFDVSDDVVWQHLELQDYDGARLWVPDRLLTLIHTSAHFVQHSLSETRILRALGREWTLWQKEIDVGHLIELARRTGTLDALEYSLSAAASLGFTTEAPSLRSPRARLLNRILPPQELVEKRPTPDYERAALSLLLVPPKETRAQLARAFFPPPMLMRAMTGENHSGPLVAQYIWRPTRALGRWVAYRFSRR